MSDRGFSTASHPRLLVSGVISTWRCRSGKEINVERDSLVETLLAEEMLAETKDGRIYLTEEGAMVAKGALKTYP
ncbi:MAG: hypothetical protein AOA65_0749 [Candidatus Bathyarchaeota archaeon BA1]|nr:MAG: hypothetical protein AOA65_0749 [Candidatus Bathyarchaeota archaeon BA1]